MGVILPFVSDGAFEPNDIEAMSLACEEACNSPSHQWRRAGSRDHRGESHRVCPARRTLPHGLARPGACGSQRGRRMLMELGVI